MLAKGKLIKGGVIFILGAITQRILDRILDWTEIILLPTAFSDILLLTGLLVGGIFIYLGIFYKSKQQQLHEDNFEPMFNHVEARLFYSSKVRYDKNERNPKKIDPRLKLILITDLKKAYWVGNYAMNLILEGKIRWHSDDEQDLDKWCEKEGYKLFKRDATENDLLEPYFEAEIRDKKAIYRRGEPILFRTRYRGMLVNGFFNNEIMPPYGQVFTDSKTSIWSWAPDTLEDMYPSTKGRLNGYINFQTSWSSNIIPYDAPIGKYRVFMRVYNHIGIGNRPIIAQKEDTFIVE